MGYTQIAEQVLFSKLPSILTFNFGLIWVVLGFLGPQCNIFGVCVRLQNVFWVYLYSWITFIFYVPLNSYIYCWPNFGVIFGFLGPQWAIFWVRVRFKSCFGVYSYRLPTFVFWELLVSDSIIQFRVCVGGMGVPTDYLVAPVLNWPGLGQFSLILWLFDLK